MAEGKKGFLLYADWINIFDQLSDNEAGKLAKYIFDFVNDRNPQIKERMLKILFEPIKAQLKRDLKEWEAKRSKHKEAGKLGGIKSGLSRRNRSKRSNASKNEANEAVTVTDTVNVNDNVIDINNKIISESEITNTIEFCSITLNRNYDREKISELWKAFCILHESHINKKERLKHFRNWIKTQPYGDSKDKPGTSAARMEALKNWGKIS